METCEQCFLNVRKRTFGKKKDLNCLISSLFLILSKNYSDFSGETSTRFVRSAFWMSSWTFWKKQIFFPWIAFLRFSGVLRGELWKFWLRISGRFFKTKIHLHRVSFWREKFPWKQKLFYRSRTPREKVLENGQKIFTRVVKIACWVSRTGFRGKGNFLWKTTSFNHYWILSEVFTLVAHFFRGLSKLQSMCHEKRFEEKNSFLKRKICVLDFWTLSQKIPVCWRQTSGRAVRTTLNLSGQNSEEIFFFRKNYIFLTFSKLEENS